MDADCNVAESELVMFDRNAQPIASMPVYKRIEIGPGPRSPLAEYRSTADICADLMKQHEAARIWQAVVDTASGVNPPSEDIT